MKEFPFLGKLIEHRTFRLKHFGFIFLTESTVPKSEMLNKTTRKYDIIRHFSPYKTISLCGVIHKA